MQSKLTFSIGIPAYNEAANIGRLISALLQQQYQSGILEEILVVSDGSKDATVAEVSQFTDQRVRIIAGVKQQGQAARQNQIFSESTSDIVILLNADVLPESSDFIEQMLQPFVQTPAADLVGARVKPIRKGSNTLSSILNWNTAWKTELFANINNSDTIYLCHGRARAFSRRLYSKLRWPNVTGEDAYSYIFAKTHDFKFAFASKAAVWYASPRTLQDHIKQSERFMYSVDELRYETELTHKQDWYQIPKTLLLKSMVTGFLRNPIYFISYCSILCLVFVIKRLHGSKKREAVWAPSETTKTIAIEDLQQA